MAKKELKNQSSWDGSLLSLVGTFLKMVLALVVSVGVPFGTGFALGVFKQGGDKMLLLATLILSVVGIIVGLAWASVIFIKWDVKHMVVSGKRMKLAAGTFNLFLNALKWTFLTIITVGVYLLFIPIVFRKWQVKNMVAYEETEEDEEEDEEEFEHEVVYYAEEEDDDDAIAPSEVVYYSVEDEE